MNTEASRVNPLGTEKVGVLLRKYAIPSIISLIINSLYNIIDQIFIGHGVGYLGNGATNIVAPIATIAIALSALFGDGLAAIYSLSLGRKEPKKAAQSVGNMIVLASIVGILFGQIAVARNARVRPERVVLRCFAFHADSMCAIVRVYPRY